MNTLHLRPHSSSLTAAGRGGRILRLHELLAVSDGSQGLPTIFGPPCPWEELDSLRNALVKWITSIVGPALFKHSHFLETMRPDPDDLFTHFPSY